jgi:metal-sulfur cluster biosynthetic enzyme
VRRPCNNPADSGERSTLPAQARAGDLAPEPKEPRMTESNATTPDAPAVDASAAPMASIVSEDQVKLALRRVKDPDLSINIIDLGLVYGIAVDGANVSVDMTLTSPGCPSGPEIMGNAERELKTLPGVGNVAVNLVWSPFWTPDKMEPRVRTYMGL